MFTTTFYSFKGGVGRSMALANVAARLADDGNRVLVVDFDLEAPGLSSFLPPKDRTPGILEYVDQYQSTHIAPDVRDFCYRYEAEDPGGLLWVMPASANTGGHADTLARIDWQALYANHDGYLMVEDLKQQWERSLGVDYVLVDSRTGHTDVEGICTRQLPNALVLLFFPNEQNRVGITEVSRRVARHNNTLSDDSKVSQLFVAANVPDLDDEYEVLARIMRDFRDSLGYEQLDAQIHHYPSLRLLGEPLFVRHRRNTQLAREFIKLTDAIRQTNPADEVGVLSHLKQVLAEGPIAGFADERRRRVLDRVYRYHADKPGILFKMAIWKDRMGDTGQALEVLDRVVELHASQPEKDVQSESEQIEARLRRARLRAQIEDDLETATQDVLFAMQSTAADVSQLVQAAKLTQRFNLGILNKLAESPSLQSLGGYEMGLLLDQLATSKASLAMALPIAERFLTDALEQNDEAMARNKLACILIGLGQFTRALEVISDGLLPVLEAGDDVLFNYAMAAWAHTGDLPLEQLRTLVARADAPGSLSTVNYEQCLALACWSLGKTELGLEYIQSAVTRSSTFFRPELSCWSYLVRHGPKMRLELESVRGLLHGNDQRPAFMKNVDLFDAVEKVH